MLVAAVLVLLAACGTGGSSGDEDSESQKSAKFPVGGTGWQYVYVSTSRDQRLLDMAVSGPDDVWAVGETGVYRDGAKLSTFLLHYDGKEWRRTASRRLTGPHLEGSDPGNVWLFGGTGPEGRSPYAARWDGEEWEEPDLPAGFPAEVRDVAVLGVHDAWVVNGEDRAWHWDGTRWSATPLPAGASALDARSAQDIWAVGSRPGKAAGKDAKDAKDAEESRQPAAMRYDGRTWKLTPTPDYRFPDPEPSLPQAYLDDVISTGPEEAYAIGLHTYESGETDDEPPEVRILLRWDGTRWAKAPDRPAGGCCDPAVVTPDGSGGLIFGGARHRTVDGSVREIGRPPRLTGLDKRRDARQKLFLEEVVPGPGEHEVWGVGAVDHGWEPGWSRGVIVRYDAEGGATASPEP